MASPFSEDSCASDQKRLFPIVVSWSFCSELLSLVEGQAVTKSHFVTSDGACVAFFAKSLIFFEGPT